MVTIPSKHHHKLYKLICTFSDEPLEHDAEVEIIDVSEYEPKRLPSKTWRECIKKIWEVDPLLGPNCGWEMKIISFITEAQRRQ